MEITSTQQTNQPQCNSSSTFYDVNVYYSNMGLPQSARVHFSLNVGRQIADYMSFDVTSIERKRQLLYNTGSQGKNVHIARRIDLSPFRPQY